MWSCLDCFFVNTVHSLLIYCTFYSKRKDRSHALITKTDAKTHRNIFFEKQIYYEISCYNLPLFTLFLQKPMGSAPSMAHGEKKQTQNSSHLGFFFKDHVLSIFFFTDKRTAVWLFVNMTETINLTLYFSFNSGQRAFALHYCICSSIKLLFFFSSLNEC